MPSLPPETYEEKKIRLAAELKALHAQIIADGGRIINLPRGYLSHTQISMRGKNEITESYRKQYYGESRYFSTPSMEFGNKVTDAMERNEPWTDFIPRFPIFERELFVNINGVPVLMYIDNMNSDNKFREQKTTKSRWNEKKISSHDQLPLYSLGLQIKDGFVQDECSLVWVQSDSPVVTRGPGLKQKVTVDDFTLTGKFEETPRIITQAERDEMWDAVRNNALQIEEDFAAIQHLY